MSDTPKQIPEDLRAGFDASEVNSDTRCIYCDQLNVVDHAHRPGHACGHCCSMHGLILHEGRYGKDLHKWIKDCLNAKNQRIVALQAENAALKLQRDLAIEWERGHCTQALSVLSAAGICTPEETYGSNTSWAINDLCKGITALKADAGRLRGALEAAYAEMNAMGDILNGMGAVTKEDQERCAPRFELVRAALAQQP